MKHRLEFHLIQDLLIFIVHPCTSLFGLCDQYENVLCSILDNHAPLRTKTVKQRPVAPWFGDDIVVEKTKRRRFEWRWRLTKNSADRDLYLNQRKLVKDMISSAKMRYYTWVSHWGLQIRSKETFLNHWPAASQKANEIVPIMLVRCWTC